MTVKASARILGIAVSDAGGRCGSLLCARRWGAIRRNSQLRLIGRQARWEAVIDPNLSFAAQVLLRQVSDWSSRST